MNFPPVTMRKLFLSDMAWTASTGRSHFENRVGIVFQGVSSLREALNARAQSDMNSGPQSKMKLAFAYPAHDSNWVGMGEELTKASQSFVQFWITVRIIFRRNTIRRCLTRCLVMPAA